MVGASIAALRRVGSGTGVLGSDDADVGSQGRVDVVGENGNLAAGRVAGHVLVKHGKDGLALRSVLGEDSLGTEETTLLTTVEVELKSVLGAVTSRGEDTEGLEDDDSAASIIVSTRAARSS